MATTTTPIDRLRAALLRGRPGPGSPLADRRASLEASVSAEQSGVRIAPDPDGERVVPDELRTDRFVLHVHGGGFVMGSPATARSITAGLARACHAEVLAARYRLAPEQPFPAAVDDLVAVYRRVVSRYRPHRLLVSGDSAGAGLVLATLAGARDAGLPMPAGAVLLSPWSDLGSVAGSPPADSDLDPMIMAWQLAEMVELYRAGRPAAEVSPSGLDLRGLPPVLVQYGDRETLAPDAAALAGALRAQGVEVAERRWPDVVHVWHAFTPRLEAATLALAEVGAWSEDTWSRSGSGS
ncbi:alpha/beta hydrolase fold domain-containing protein [Pseudonocardia sp. GCM10023141]|uniref:alpha/beta hydrolase fold domain-containing protein n=1 Tax=Pseudonocardia sp. GCM10023141 TaxID=3252653 RepID=UPI0036109970